MADLATNNSGLGKGGVAGSNAGNAHYNPREFSWSATAVSFGALMSVLQAYTQMRQDQAQIANDMSIDISNAALATGKAQMQAADAQAQATEEQANMSYAQAAGAGIGAVASITALGVAARSGSQVKPMETIANSMNEPGALTPAQGIYGDNLNDTREVDASVQSMQNKLLNGGYTAKDLTTQDANGNTGLSRVMGQDVDGNDVTLKDLIETMPDNTKFEAAQKAVCDISAKAQTSYQGAQQLASTVSQIANSVGQSASSVYSGAQQVQVAAHQQEQGAQQALQTYAQAEQTLDNSTYSNIKQTQQYADSGVSNTFSFINNMINNEMRG